MGTPNPEKVEKARAFMLQWFHLTRWSAKQPTISKSTGSLNGWISWPKRFPTLSLLKSWAAITSAVS